MSARPPLRRGGESLPRDERLRRRADFLKCYRQGRRQHGSLVVLYVVESDDERCRPRLGITVSRKVGGSVERHRIKRRIKEIYRRWPERERLPPLDLMVHVKPAARTAGFERLRAELHRLFRRALKQGAPAR